MELKDNLLIEEKEKRKKRVKKVTVSFFTIMLLLTFFSNTIMNYSLPQVATKKVESGIIEKGIKGTGIVEVVGDDSDTKEEEQEKNEKKQMTIFVNQTLDDTIKVGMEGDIEAPSSAKSGKAILEEIVNNADGTGASLIFHIEEDTIPVGQSITISLNRQELSYPLVVPNSAVRNDKEGTFVFVLETKNSPLGNRYFAKRVPVKIEAQDSVQVAISGILEQSDYVITISEDILEAGEQVRLRKE